MRRAKAGLAEMPTTTFPSSHAAWAIIAMIFAFEGSLLAGTLFTPFLLLSAFGTFYLAQHYFIDAPAGIIVGIVSALIASFVFRERGRDTSTRVVRNSV